MCKCFVHSRNVNSHEGGMNTNLFEAIYYRSGRNRTVVADAKACKGAYERSTMRSWPTLWLYITYLTFTA